MTKRQPDASATAKTLNRLLAKSARTAKRLKTLAQKATRRKPRPKPRQAKPTA